MAKKKRTSKKQRLAAIARKRSGKLSNRLVDFISTANTVNTIGGDALNSGGTIFQKLGNFVNAFTGRTAGINLVPNAQTYQKVWNPAGIMNEQTMSGIGAIAYTILARAKFNPLGKYMPLKGEAARYGKLNIAGGFLGIFRDNLGGGQQSFSFSPSPQIQSNTMVGAN